MLPILWGLCTDASTITQIYKLLLILCSSIERLGKGKIIYLHRAPTARSCRLLRCDEKFLGAGNNWSIMRGRHQKKIFSLPAPLYLIRSKGEESNYVDALKKEDWKGERDFGKVYSRMEWRGEKIHKKWQSLTFVASAPDLPLLSTPVKGLWWASHDHLE